ncbi:MAG: ABC transporter substrate-binding protein [Burkholderiales bacterium]
MKLIDSVCKSLAVIVLASFAASSFAQKSGGTLRVPLRENPSSASLHEESSITAISPFMAVFNNLVIYDQHEEMARAESMRPDLATEWSWSPDNKVLTMKLRQGVRWHDGKPFTSADVQCTWDMILEKRPSNWRKNSHKEWYGNLKEVSVNGPFEVRFVLGRAQPSFLSFLASGWSPVYPCHVDGRVMRQKPIGTGPFKVAEFKPNDVIRLVKNTDYWKPGRPHLDGIVYRIMPSTATRVLSFVSGEFDMTGSSTVTPHTLKDVQAQVPGAVCSTTGTMVTGVVLMNHKVAPFDNPKVRRAISLALDRNAFVAAQQGGGRLGGVMMSPPYGNWGLTTAQLEAVPGFGKNVDANRAEARKLMEEAGYGPNKKLKTSFIVRTSAPNFTMGATLAADQLRSIYIDGEIEQKEYTVFTGAIIKGAYSMAFETSGSAIDDPDVVLYENFKCASIRNYTKYCNPAVEAKIDEQSATVDPAKRKQLVNALDLMLQQDVARAAVYHSTSSVCWQPYVKGYVRSLNGIYTHHRMEDVWIDK